MHAMMVPYSIPGGGSNGEEVGVMQCASSMVYVMNIGRWALPSAGTCRRTASARTMSIMERWNALHSLLTVSMNSSKLTPSPNAEYNALIEIAQCPKTLRSCSCSGAPFVNDVLSCMWFSALNMRCSCSRCAVCWGRAAASVAACCCSKVGRCRSTRDLPQPRPPEMNTAAAACPGQSIRSIAANIWIARSATVNVPVEPHTGYVVVKHAI